MQRVEDNEEIIERVAAIDVGKAEQSVGDKAPSADRWSYVAITYDGATLRMYIEGEQVSSRPAAGAIEASDDPLWIGGNLPYGEHFDGEIDEVRVYDRALAQGEIAHDMATPVAPASGLVAAYAFDTGSGNVAMGTHLGRRHG